MPQYQRKGYVVSYIKRGRKTFIKVTEDHTKPAPVIPASVQEEQPTFPAEVLALLTH